MTCLRLPPTLEGEPDPFRIARLVFGIADWRRRHPAEQIVDLGAAWQALHYLDELGMDVIYLEPERVAAAAEHLAETPFETIAERFDPAAMAAAEVQDAADMDRDRVLAPAYARVTAFFTEAAADRQAVFKVLTAAG